MLRNQAVQTIVTRMTRPRNPALDQIVHLPVDRPQPRLKFTPMSRPVFRATATHSSARDAATASGFSTKTCTPRFIASIAISVWL